MMLEGRAIAPFLRALEGLRFGRLELTLPDGRRHVFEGPEPGPDAAMTIRDARAITALAATGDIGLTEAYRDGWVDTPDLTELLRLGLRNEDALDRYLYGHRLQALAIRVLYWLNRNSRAGSRRNIRAHYDLGNDFYALWLDETMTYSAAIYGDGDGLKDAQSRKYQRILDGLEGRSGRLLEIGCGWGGFADHASTRGDFAQKGLTLSLEQADWARRRLAGRNAEVALQDYRDERGRFDHVVSIEMFEAVGERYWPTWFAAVRNALTERGRAMVQTITVADRYFDRYRAGGDMIRSFIFPGGMLPSPTRFEAGAAAAGLRVEDRFAFGPDYARTLQAWLDRFEARLPEVRALGFDEAFVRVWRFYLAACIASFEVGRTDVMQLRLARA